MSLPTSNLSGMVDLHSHADRIGVTVRTSLTLPRGAWGLYLHNARTILLRADLGPVQRYSTLAHELGHAYHGHPYWAPAWEAEADEYAARLLIRPECLHHYAAAHDTAQAVAHELGVLPRLVRVAAGLYQSTASAAAMSSS